MANGTRSRSAFLVCFTALLLGCHSTPQFVFEPAYRDALDKFNRGNFNLALAEIDLDLSKIHNKQSDDAWQFRLLKADIYIWQGRSQDALNLLTTGLRSAELPHDLAAHRMVLLGIAESNLQHLEIADKDFIDAARLNQPEIPAITRRLLLGEGKVAALRGQFVGAEEMFRRALTIAHQERAPLAEANAMGNLGMLSMRQRHYADAVDWLNTSLALTESQSATAPTIRTIGNLGWAYYEMGDLERAQDHFDKAASLARQNGMSGDEQTWLMGMAAVQFLQRRLLDSQRTYQRSIRIARQLDDRQEMIYGLNNLARLALLQNQADAAERWNREASVLEREIGDHESELYSNLYDAQIAAARNRPEASEVYLHRVLSAPQADVVLKSEALDLLAGLEAGQHHLQAAQRLFVEGTAMLDKAQQELGRTEFQLSYPTFAEGIYDDYVNFLVSNGKQNEALSVVETHRARTLMAGLKPDTRLLRSATWSKAALQNAAKNGHIVLSYWLGREHSYVWLIGPSGVHMAVLPDQDRVASLVGRYQARLNASFGASGPDSGAGQELYQMLIGPVAQWMPPTAAITIVPDGVLCGLNFETLVVPSPKPHYWIEDASLTVASSIALLGRQPDARQSPVPQPVQTLLVVGDPKTPASYPGLTHAHAEVAAVAKHFGKEQERLLTGAAATPTAYFAAKPEDYAVIHFVAHGTASRISPLDSAVVLSDDGKSYNLFARQIMSHAIHARLVTISACDSAGDRVYSAEGLVGMSWAFLRAGAHEVVAALWEVNDASTPHFMDMFYAQVAQGRDPAQALRDAKLEMLHSGTIYAKPFYWAPFVLYQGQ